MNFSRHPWDIERRRVLTAAALLALALLLVSGIALAAGVRSWTETQALTRAVPTLSSEGLDLNGVTGWKLTVSANSGQTLSGGSIACDYYSPWLSRWVANSDLTFTVPSGKRDATWNDRKPPVPLGRLLCRTVSVTVSGGTDVAVRIDAMTQ